MFALVIFAICWNKKNIHSAKNKIIKVEFVSMNKNKSKNYTNYFHTSLIYKRKGKSLNRITKNNSYFNDHNPLNIPNAL